MGNRACAEDMPESVLRNMGDDGLVAFTEADLLFFLGSSLKSY